MAESSALRRAWLGAALATAVLYHPITSAQGPAAAPAPTPPSAMVNPFTITQGWPSLDAGMKWGASINMIPDQTGGTWMLFRSEPPIIHFDAGGKITKKFGEGTFVQAHGMCRDAEGNFWAGDSGPFAESPATAGRGFQLFKFSPEGKLLLSLGKAGVSKAGPDTFIGPTACVVLPNGDLMVADGHWPRPASAQQDGDRLVRLSKDGRFLNQYGKYGSEAGQFMGPHALALDSQGRLFVADRSNNRIQIFDKDMKFVDEWRHFGRPSGITILKDDTLYVADSESGQAIDGPKDAPEGAGRSPRNPGWKNGVRIGSAKDGSLEYFIPGTRPEGMAADERGNVFAGLTSGCETSLSGGCLQKWTRR